MYRSWLSFLLVAFLVTPVSLQLSSHRRFRQQIPSPRNTCPVGDSTYSVGETFTWNSQSKVIRCSCKIGPRIHCDWSPTTSRSNKCRDSATDALKYPGETWERIRNGKILDCLCISGPLGMQINCSDENRCHHNGVSYKKGAQFETRSPSGRKMDCECQGQKKLSCKYEERLPAPETNPQRIENYILRGARVHYPHITTLQACRTGSRVVTSGAVWNQTNTNALGVRALEECTCADAIVRCRTLRVLDQIEPHCVSLDGRLRTVGKRWLRTRQHYPHQEYICQCYGHLNYRCRRTTVPHCIDNVAGEIRAAGDRWKRVHETIPNLVFQCTCNRNKRITCKDIGKCSEPPAPANGALLCANVGSAGDNQMVYCKPMCLSDYEFINPQRYFRIWEVCSARSLHRWSGGFVGDPDAIARCRGRDETSRRGHASLHLPTNDCSGLTSSEIEEQKTLFLVQLRRRHLCRNKCEITSFKCGAME